MRYFLSLIFLPLFMFSAQDAVCLETGADIGKIAPAFELPDVNGKKVTLAEYKGKVILLNFWATFCGPCKAEMPSLNNLYLAFKNKGFLVLAISTDPSEKPVRSFLDGKAISFPVLVDKDQEVYFDLYGILGLPTSLIIDRDGVIRDKIRGEREWDSKEMKEKIEKLLTSNKSGGK